jgi:hypothetical protein
MVGAQKKDQTGTKLNSVSVLIVIYNNQEFLQQ